jgi:carboxypeptidase Q
MKLSAMNAIGGLSTDRNPGFLAGQDRTPGANLESDMPATPPVGARLLALLSIGALLWATTQLLAESAPSDSGGLTLTPQDHDTAAQLIQAAGKTGIAFQRLSRLCDTFGPRLSGTTNLEAAIDWVLGEMKADGLEHVRGEEVRVPHWVRGSEAAEMLEPVHRTLRMTGLGGSVGTVGEGITGPVVVVRNFAELHQHKSDVPGKIVLFNAPFVTYGETVAYRVRGAVEAARLGAVACLVRSITPFSLQTPHTGAMEYEEGVARIPSAAITVEDAEQLQRWQDRGRAIVVHLQMSAAMAPDARSRNVVAELVGREHPEEIVLVSGHLDSWDIAPGAQDDGGGAIAAWEAVRLMRELGLQPRRTVRVVLWTNEENGTRGARDYAARHREELSKHVLAIESDEGTFEPTGFTFKGRAEAEGKVNRIASLLGAIHAEKIVPGDAGTDVNVLARSGVPAMELTVENSKYFWFHHTASDTPDKVNPRDLARCAAAMAVMAYTVADLPRPLNVP